MTKSRLTKVEPDSIKFVAKVKAERTYNYIRNNGGTLIDKEDVKKTIFMRLEGAPVPVAKKIPIFTNI